MSDQSGERGGIPGHIISPALRRERSHGPLGRLLAKVPEPIRNASILAGVLALIGFGSSIDTPPQQSPETPTSPTQTAKAQLANEAADLRARSTVMAQYTPESTAIKPPTPTVAPTATAKLPGTLPPFK